MRRHGLVDMNTTPYSGRTGVGFLRVILLFGSVAVALGLILIPLLMQRADKQLSQSLFSHQPDYTTTGSIKTDESLPSIKPWMPPQR